MFDSNGSDHSLKLTDVVVVTFTEKETRHISEKGRAANRANKQPSSEYLSVHARFIYILCYVYMSYGESKSITSYLLLSMNKMS